MFANVAMTMRMGEESWGRCSEHSGMIQTRPEYSKERSTSFEYGLTCSIWTIDILHPAHRHRG